MLVFALQDFTNLQQESAQRVAVVVKDVQLLQAFAQLVILMPNW
jgi:hypothetical protein